MTDKAPCYTGNGPTADGQRNSVENNQSEEERLEGMRDVRVKTEHGARPPIQEASNQAPPAPPKRVKEEYQNGA